MSVSPKDQAITEGVHHVGLSVSDLQKSVDFFIDVLNFKKVGEKPNYPAIFVSDGKVTLTLWQVEDPENFTAFDRKQNVGLHHIALKLPSIEVLNTVHEKLKDYGVEIEFPPTPRATPNSQHLMCTIPGGPRMELVGG